MPTVIDSLLMELGLDAKKFEKGTKQAQEALAKTRERIAEAGRQIEASTAESFGKAGKNASDAFEKAADDIADDSKKIEDTTKKSFEKVGESAKQSARKTKEEVEKTGKEVQEVSAKVSDGIGRITREALAMFAVFTGASSIKNFVTEITAGDSALGRFAANLGSTPQNLSAWGMAVERVGGDAHAAMGSIQSLSDKLMGLHIMGRQLPDEMAVLARRGGQNIDLSHGPESALTDIAANIQNVAKREGRPTASWLGRNIGLDEGSINLMIEKGPALRAELVQLKELAPSEKDVKAAQELQAAWVSLQQTVTQLGRKILTDLSPPLKDIIKDMGEWLKANREDLSKSFVDLGNYLRGDGGKEIKKFFEDIAYLTKETAKLLRESMTLGNKLSPYVSGPQATPETTPIGFGLGWEPPSWYKKIKQKMGYGDEGATAMTITPSATPSPSVPAPDYAASPSESPSPRRGTVAGGIDRSRFRAELAANPALKEKILAISAGENLDPNANLAVFESMMNRASMMKTSLSYESSLARDGGYYAGYNPSAINIPKNQKVGKYRLDRIRKNRAMVEENLEKALSGSNISNYATDNASQGWGWRRMHGMYQMDYTSGGEYFGHPATSKARGAYPEPLKNRPGYQAWRRSVSEQSDANGGQSSDNAWNGQGALAAWAGLPSGAQLSAANASTNNYSNSSVEWNFHGPINLNSTVSDAAKFKSDLHSSFANGAYVYGAQSGAQ